MEERIKKPWPTKDAMSQIYTQHLWGGDEYDFYSGEGSYQSAIVTPYINAVTSFLTSFEEPFTVCDLGCGDFNVSKELVEHSQNFIAIDIVADLIDRNKEKYKAKNLEFHCLDIAKDDLPVADCAIVRQVLQHLSNAEIQSIARKLSAFKYVILTEYLPEGDFVPNVDIISGQGIRLKKGSGVQLLESPFLWEVKTERELLAVDVDNGRIVTVIYEV